MLDAILID